MKIDRRRINDDRRRVFGENRDLIAFVCECADDDCNRTVPLGPADYETRRASEPGLVLAPEHGEAAAL